MGIGARSLEFQSKEIQPTSFFHVWEVILAPKEFRRKGEASKSELDWDLG